MKRHRVLLHNHSTWSDGKLTLSEVARWGRRFSACAVVMSDHDYHFTPEKWADYVAACRQVSTAACRVIPGIEYSSPQDEIHVVTIGTDRFHGARRNISNLLQDVRRSGGVSILAHPTRKNALRHVDERVFELLDGIEIWNRKVDGLAPVAYHFDLANVRSMAVTAGMDLHTRRQLFPMWNEIESAGETLDEEAIVDSIRRRTITPSCIIGRIEPNATGMTTNALLASSERLRRWARDKRDRFQRPNANSRLS